MDLLRLIVQRLFSVKSIVTLALTGVFSYLAVTGKVSGNEFLTIFTVIIGFYFGTQSERREQEDKAHAYSEEKEEPPPFNKKQTEQEGATLD